MNFTFLSVSEIHNGYAAEQESAVRKIKGAMEKGAKLVITPRKDQNGYPYFWVDFVLPHKTGGVKLFVNVAIIDFIYRYLTIGKIDNFNLEPSGLEKMRDDYSEKNFSLDLFKYEVQQGKRVNITVSTSAKFKCFISYTHGKVFYSFDTSDEINDFLEEKDLLN